MTAFLSLGIGPGADIKRFITLGLDIGGPWLDRRPTADPWTDRETVLDTWIDEPTLATVWADV